MSNASTPAAASAPPRPQGSPPLVMSRVQRALHNLADDKFNLASDDLVSHVAWFTTGTGLDVLIEKRTTSEDDGDDDVVEAALKCIAMVDPVENWFYVCRGWTGQNNAGPLSKAKARGFLTPGNGARGSLFATWSNVSSNLAKLESLQVSKRGSSGPSSYSTLTADKRVRVRHALFIEKGEGVEPPDDESFPMDTWKCRNEAAQRELRKIVDAGSHHGQVMPAYDENDNLISPTNYQSKLRGAVVQITLAMSHQYFPSDNKNNYYLDIRKIQVVKPPVGMPSSPSKRRAVVEESSNERKQKKKKGLAAASD